MRYDEKLEERLVVDYIKKHKRKPNRATLRVLMDEYKRNHPALNSLGFSGHEVKTVGFREPSSVEKENTNRQAVFDDMLVVKKSLDDSMQLLEDSYRGFSSTRVKIDKSLSALESRLDNLLLLNDRGSMFWHGVEEDFKSGEHIDIDATTASVQNGYCILGSDHFTKYDLLDSRMTYSTSGSNRILSVVQSNNLDVLKQDDGEVWSALVYTDNMNGEVNLMINVELDVPSYIGQIKLNATGVGVNSRCFCTIMYSTDGQAFKALEPSRRNLNNDTLVFSLGVEGVQKLRFVLSKDSADTKAGNQNQWVYGYLINSLELYTDKLSEKKGNVLVAGPYVLYDFKADPVKYTKASLSACVVNPDGCDVFWYLSNDGSTYIPVSSANNFNQLVTFGQTSENKQYLDGGVSLDGLLTTAVGLENVSYGHEAILNAYMNQAEGLVVNRNTILVKRNIVNSLASSGWMFNPGTEEYETTIFVGQETKRVLQLGNTSLYVNNVLVTGNYELPQGYSSVRVNTSNWSEVPAGLTTEQQFMDQDILYPYNHKYLIGGYNYPTGYIGLKKYVGFEEQFGALLTYMPPEKFNRINTYDFNNLKYYTIENVNGQSYFKIKVDKRDSSWDSELVNISWLSGNSLTNQLWVKAVLESANNQQSPIIEHFSVRVI